MYSDDTFAKELQGAYDFWWFDGGDGSKDSPPWQINTVAVSGGCPEDPKEAVKVTYTDGPGYWGGFFFQFADPPMDASQYESLCFWIKGQKGGEEVQIGILDYETIPPGPKVRISDYITVTTEWQPVTIPLSDFGGQDTSKLFQPFIVAFEHRVNGEDVTVYIDYIKLV